MRRDDESTAPVDVLVVDDNAADARLVEELLKHEDFPLRLHVVSSSDEALAFLRREGRFAHAPRPDLVLLDLNLCTRSGREVLRDIKASEDLRSIPVVMHTSSECADDIRDCYALQANCYVFKGCTYEQFERTVRGVAEFWCQIARLPVSRRSTGG